MIEFEELLRILRATFAVHGRSILLVSLLAGVVAFAASYLVPEKYEATALVLIRPQEYPGVMASTPSAKEMLSLPASGSAVQVDTPSRTYIEVIKSQSVAEQVVKKLGLDERLRLRDDASLADRFRYRLRTTVLGLRDLAKFGRLLEHSPLDLAVARHRENITLSTVKDTFVFEISYLSGDPEEAASVANASADVFVAYSSALNESEAKGNREYIEQQLAATGPKLEAARSELQVFQEVNRTVALTEERTERIKSIASLRVDLDETEADLAGQLQNYTPSNPQAKLVTGKRDSLRRAIAAQEKELQAMPEKERKLATLNLEVRTLESGYEYLRAQHEEARLRESKSIAEISIVSPAVVPSMPVKPVKITYAGIAMALGFFASLAVALYLEAADPLLRSGDDAQRALGVPLLAGIPKLEGSGPTA